MPPKRLPTTRLNPANEDNLISGIWLRWGKLNQAESFIGLFIIFIPFWWFLGWSNTLTLLVIGITGFEFLQRGKLDLKPPSLIVVLAIAFGLYRLVSVCLNSETITPSVILGPINSLICYGLLLWYIQSNKLRVRVQVLAWAFSVLALQMLVLWLVVHFIFSEPDYTPIRSIFGLLTSKNERYIPGVGNSNYLLLYFAKDKVFAGLSRFAFFFPGPESLALMICFMGLVALEIKKRAWSISLFSVCVFLLMLSGTRSAWIAFSVVVVIRYLVTIGNQFGLHMILLLIAIVSFTTLSVPSATTIVVDTFSNTAEATSNLRADSTDIREKIYERTINAVISEPEHLLFGRGVTGETVLPGYAPAMIGSHSFILGTLIYRSGLVGTAIFFAYWTLLINWFYKERASKPICCLLIIVLFSMTFTTMELEMPVMPITLLCAVLYQPKLSLL